MTSADEVKWLAEVDAAVRAEIDGTLTPRVWVHAGKRSTAVRRRPFKRWGRWFVRWCGTAELIEPEMRHGQWLFEANWGWKK